MRRSFHPWQARSRGGFTLLEITMVLFVMVLFLAIASISFLGINEEAVLRRPAGELQQMARQAIQRAGMYEQPEVIVFEKNGFGLRFSGTASPTRREQQWLRHVQVPDTVVMQIKRWGDKDFKSAVGQRWVMQPSGLCEPITVRFETNHSFIEMQFNPITGGVADEHLMIASQ